VYKRQESQDSSVPDFSYVPEVWEHTFNNVFGFKQDTELGQSLRFWIKTQSLSDLWDFASWNPSDFDEDAMAYKDTHNEFHVLNKAAIHQFKKSMAIS
jgi:hypothetical protein